MFGKKRDVAQLPCDWCGRAVPDRPDEEVKTLNCCACGFPLPCEAKFVASEIFAAGRSCETGRPSIFRVMRDSARERAATAEVAAIDRMAELWHRPPEEWELDRLGPRVIVGAKVRISVDGGRTWHADLGPAPDGNGRYVQIVLRDEVVELRGGVSESFVLPPGFWPRR